MDHLRLSSGVLSRKHPRLATMKIVSMVDEIFCLAIRNGFVVLAPANPCDDYQHWILDWMSNTSPKDEKGFLCFALINKATGEAIQHSIGECQPVRLVPYNWDQPDESVLWSESEDTGKGFKFIRMVNNTRLNIDAYFGDDQFGGVYDGMTVVLSKWRNKNQKWKILPWKLYPPVQNTVRLFCRAEEKYSLSIRKGKVILAPANPLDEHQHWIREMKYSKVVKDAEGFPSFALVNKATGQAIGHGIGSHTRSQLVNLVRYNADRINASVLWTESRDMGGGFRCIKVFTNIKLVLDAFLGDAIKVRDGNNVCLHKWLNGKNRLNGRNQIWKIAPYPLLHQ